MEIGQWVISVHTAEALCLQTQTTEREAYTNLDRRPSTILMVARLRLRRNRGSSVIGNAARGVGDNGGVRRVDVVLFVADWSRNPLKFLHVGQPDVGVAGLPSSDGGHDNGDDVSRKDYPVEETKRSDRLSGSAERAYATNDTTEGGSGLSTSGKPHDGEIRQPSNLEGHPGREGAITEATSDGRSAHGSQMNDRSGDTKGRKGEINAKVVCGLGEGVRRESENYQSKEVGRR